MPSAGTYPALKGVGMHTTSVRQRCDVLGACLEWRAPDWDSGDSQSALQRSSTAGDSRHGLLRIAM